MLQLTIFSVLIVAVCLLAYRYVWLTYGFTETAVVLCLFRRIKIPLVRLSNIESAETLPIWKTYFHWGFATRVFGDPGILVVKKRGLILEIILTPDDPLAFLDELERRLPVA